MSARQPARTHFTVEEMRAFQRGCRVEWREQNRWFQGIVTQGPRVDRFDCHFVRVRSVDVSTPGVANGEVIECRPNGVRPV